MLGGADEGIVKRWLPQVSLISRPPPIPDTLGPEFEDAHFEDPDQIGDGGCGDDFRMRSEMEDNVQVVGHDDMRIDFNAAFRSMKLE